MAKTTKQNKSPSQILTVRVPDNNKYKKQVEEHLCVLADRLRIARKESGQSMRDVDKATGISYTNISDYENANSIPRLDTVITFALHYKVSLDWLIGLEI